MTAPAIPADRPAISTTVRTNAGLDLGFALLWSKTITRRHGVYWWATTTPVGAALVAFRPSTEGVRVDAWGEGASWAVSQVPALVGLRDATVDAFRPIHPVLRALADRFGAFRVGATGRWYEAVVTTAIGQRVVTADAGQSRARLARRHGDASLGGPVAILPDPATLLGLRDHDFHAAGIELSRTRVLRVAAKYADRLERLDGVPGADAVAWMQLLPGIGPWTAGITSAIAGGDPDAVPVGDLHVPGMVTYALTGEVGDDARMLEALEPFAGHRGRVVRMIKMGGAGPPRHRPKPFRTDISTY
ncbi:MAG: DNA-3-methyladenine glycosylase 2 family protein [Actinomycetota bacterium]